MYRLDTILDSYIPLRYAGGMRKRDLRGFVVGRLTVLDFDHSNAHHVGYWRCACTCGQQCVVRASSLVSGATRSCGCFAREDARRRGAEQRLHLTGTKFTRLTVEGYAGKDRQGLALWQCRCDCGKTHTVRGSSLTTGVVKSCGCLSRELTAQRLTTHGDTGSQAHRSWRHMRARCLDPNNVHYRHYGGRGITICPEWDDYAVFRADMGEPKTGQTLDRINPNGNYEPANCRWASRQVQARNQRERKNQSGHRGVYRTKSGKWVSQIRIGNGKRACGPARATIVEALEDRMELERLHWTDE